MAEPIAPTAGPTTEPAALQVPPCFGHPAGRPIRINRPLLPPLDRIAPYIAEVDAARFYTNFGTMHKRLRLGLAAHLGESMQRCGGLVRLPL